MDNSPDKIVSDKNKVYTACRNTLKGIIKRREEENSNGIYIRSVYSDDQEISMVIQLLIINGCNERDFLDQYIGINDEYIEGIFVSDEMQSRGIGKILLDYIKDKKDRLQLKVYQKNVRAMSFYQREGFTIQSEEMDEFTGEKEYVMNWESSGI